MGHEGSYLCRQHRGEGQAAVDGDGAAVGVGMGCVERSRLMGGSESITRMEKVKDLAFFFKANEVNGTEFSG